jgi:uncharacterized protein (DUF1501 family)
MIGRRVFVRRSAMAFLAMGLPPEVLVRPLLRGTREAAARKTLICIFQRGAVDGLSMVVPHGEGAYYSSRRSIAVPAPGRSPSSERALDLDGFFGLHPAMAPLQPLYDAGELAVVHAVGSPHPTRSHFDAQDFMELATPGVRTTADGWLNRVLQARDCDGCRGRELADGALHTADHLVGQVGVAGSEVAALRGVSLTSALPRSLTGPHPALAIPDLESFGRGAGAGLETLYRTQGGDAVSGPAGEAFEAVEVLRRIDPASYRTDVEYPRGPFGDSLRQIAQLIKAGVGVEIAFAELGGWDTHVAQGGVQGALARNLGQLARGIRSLHADLGGAMQNVVILTMSEFGRTVEENGSRGTDHGHANCMLVLGDGVRGGRVLGDWPGVAPEDRFEGRDLAVTTDFRDVFAEIVRGHLEVSRLGDVFPGYDVSTDRFRGVLG